MYPLTFRCSKYLEKIKFENSTKLKHSIAKKNKDMKF